MPVWLGCRFRNPPRPKGNPMKDKETFILGDGIKTLINVQITAGTAHKPSGDQVFAILELTLSNGPGRKPDTVRVSVRADELGKLADHLATQARLLTSKLTPAGGAKH